MKKSKKFLFGLFVFLFAVCLTGCGNKKALSSSEFKSKMEGYSYQVQDATNQFANYDFVKQVYIALNGNYQIEFYELDNVDNAKSFFENNKTIFKNSKTGSSFDTWVNVGNHSKYTLKTDGKYKVVSRIENTVIYLNVDDKYLDDIKSVLKKLGY